MSRKFNLYTQTDLTAGAADLQLQLLEPSRCRKPTRKLDLKVKTERTADAVNQEQKQSCWKKGGGAHFPINISWCSDVVTLVSHYSPDRKYSTVKCHPYYRLRDFTSAIPTAVYISPHTDVKNALDVIYTTTNTLEMKFPEALFIVAGNFNQASLKQLLPRYHQHISCPTRGLNILDHCYTAINDAYGFIPCPHFRKSDHYTVFLLPAYKPKLKQEGPSQKEQDASSTVTSALTAPDTPISSITTANVRSVFLGVNPKKAVGLDGVLGRALRSCVDQLAE
eukprot:g37275.t1